MLPDAPPGAHSALKLVDLRQQIDRLELEFSREAASFANTDFWDRDGSNSALDWIRFNCRMTSNAAADRIAVGQRLAGLGASVRALEAGEIGFAHMTVMARTAGAVGEPFDERKLLELARENSPGKFFYKAQHYRHAIDAQAYGQEQNEVVENRRLSLSTAENGCLLLSGALDPVGGAAVRSALEPLARPSGEHDDRQPEQRYADALVELAHGGKPANLQITASLETVKDLAGAPGGDMEFSLPLSSATVRRLACDCNVTRVLLNEESAVIDVGRSKRVTSGPMRRALKVRDGHCRWPGCERPASWCDGHHLVHWINGGSTNLENLVLLWGLLPKGSYKASGVGFAV